LHAFGSENTFVNEMSNYHRAITVSPASTPGMQRLWATQGAVTVAEYYANVERFNPQARPSSWYPSVGQTITFTGSGWKPEEIVKLYRNGIDTGRSVKVAGGTPFFYDVRGRLPGGYPFTPGSELSFVVPQSTRGHASTYELRGSNSGGKVTFVISTAL